MDLDMHTVGVSILAGSSMSYKYKAFYQLNSHM